MADPNVDIAELEAAFAKDPATAFQPLTEAYLSQGRFMEAMVVCKKGIKADPEQAAGRLLLARVYAEQGKVPKATIEVKKLLEIDDNSAPGHFFLGQLHERAGRFDESIAAFQRTLEIDAHHEGAIEALRAKGIEVEVGPTAEEIAAQEAAEAAEAKRVEDERVAAEAAEAAAAVAQQAAETPARPPPRDGPTSMPTTPPTGEFPRPAVQQRAARPPAGGSFESAFMGGYDPVQQNKSQNKKLGLSFTFALFTVLLLVVAGLVFGLFRAKERAEQVAKFTNAAEKSIKRDGTKDLLNAAASLEQAIDVDDSNEGAASKLAYVYEVLLYERGLGQREVTERVEKGDIKVRHAAALPRAIDVAEDNPYTKVAGAIAALRRSEPQKAITSLNDLKGNAFIDLWLARAHLANRDGKAALQLVEQHYKNVTNPGQLAFVGKAFRTAGQLVNGGLALNAAIKTSDDHDVARAERAMLSLEVADMNYAYADVKYLADMGKDNIGLRQYGLMALGRGELSRLNDKNEADSDFATARTLVPIHPDTLVIEARGLKAAGKMDEAVEKLENAAKQAPTRVGIWANLIEYAAEARKVSVATKAYDDAQKIWPEHPALEVAKGYIAMRRRKIPDGIKELRAFSKKLDDKDPNVLTMVGLLELAKGDEEAAIATLTDAATKLKGRTGFERAQTYTTLGRALAKAKRDNDAKGAFAQAIKSNGTYPEAYYYLAQVFERQESSEAKTMYQNAVKFGLDGRKKKIAQEKSR